VGNQAVADAVAGDARDFGHTSLFQHNGRLQSSLDQRVCRGVLSVGQGRGTLHAGTTRRGQCNIGVFSVVGELGSLRHCHRAGRERRA
jgi:hypothetical protein